MRSFAARLRSCPHALGILCALLLVGDLADAQTDPLPSWNDGAAKRAIIAFVTATADTADPKFVAPEERIAVFDQDGTTWVEQPMYTQVVYCLQQVPALAQRQPDLKTVEPFKTVLSGDRAALAKLGMPELQKLLAATLTGMTVEQFAAGVKDWLSTAKHPRFGRPYVELTYRPMLEVMKLFRDHGYKTYFVTGGGQDFVRVYAQQVYDIPPSRWSGARARPSSATTRTASRF